VNFVFPAFLIALALLAIPVIIHLFNFRRFKKINFPDIRFLKEIKEDTNRRSQLKKLLILASRMLALLAAILAFAQPYFSKDGEKVSDRSNAVSIYIDNTYSMGLEKNSIPLLEMAKEKARDIVNSFEETDRFQILGNEFAPQESRFYTQKEALEELSRMQLSAKPRKAKVVLEKQRKLLSTEPGSNPLIAYISDFQKNAFPSSTNTSDTIQKYFIPIDTDGTSNISIDTARLESGGISLQQNNKIAVRLQNHGQATRQTAVTLEVNGQIKSVVNAEVPARAKKTDTLSFTPSRAGIQKMKIYLNDHPMVFDDTFYIAGKVVSNYSVLILNQSNANAYLNSVFKPNAQFKVDNNNVSSFNADLLNNYSLVILNSCTAIPPTLIESIDNFVRNGGGLMVFAPSSPQKGNINSLLGKLSGSSLTDFSTEKSYVTSFSKSHPIFADIFDKVPENVDLPNVFKHHRISTASLTAQQKLFTFSNGDAFLNSYSVGAGKFYLCASSADKTSSSFPSSYWFLPVIYKMAYSNRQGDLHSYSIGDGRSMRIKSSRSSSDKGVYHMRNGQQDIVPAQRASGQQIVLDPTGNVKQAAIYSLYIPGSKDSLSAGINYSRTESELDYWNLKELRGLSKLKNATWLDFNEQAGNTLNTLNKGTPLWKVCIIFALIFLLIEILLIRFLK